MRKESFLYGDEYQENKMRAAGPKIQAIDTKRVFIIEAERGSGYEKI